MANAAHQNLHVDIVVAGASFTGLALGLAVADQLGGDVRIAVVAPQRAGEPANDVRASALTAGSRHLLSALGVWDAIAVHVQPVTRIDITDSRLGDAVRPVLLSYETLAADGQPAIGIVENVRLQAALDAAVSRRAPAIQRIDGRIAELDTSGGTARATLVGGRQLQADLVVAADGRRSMLREAAGIGIVGWDYDQTGIVTTVALERPHQGCAVQHFLPGGPFAVLPLPADRACITWSEARPEASRILALDDAGFHAELATRLGARLGPFRIDGTRQSWPLDMHLARALVADRLVLIGDAAHGVHPIAGQGLNLGLRDVAVLADVVADAARLGLDIGHRTILERYERWRRLDSAMSAAAFDGLNRLFSTESTLLRSARSAGLGLVDRMPGLKRFLVAEASGLTGDVPRLLRGSSA